VTQDVFAVLLILLPPLLFAGMVLAGTSTRVAWRPALPYVLLGIYVVFGILLQPVPGWIYFRPEFWSVVGLLALYDALSRGAGATARRRSRA
jgi:hypothetical protein